MTTLTSSNGTALGSVCFGCMQFGGTADDAASKAMFDACRAEGVSFFDTAHVYTDGASEQMLGQYVAQDREDLIIATKAGYVGGHDPANLRKQFDESRTRLGMDMVDILYLHRFDDDTPLETSFEVLAQMQQSGLIRYIGVSNFAAWQVMKAQAVAATLGTRIDILQPMYSLVKRQAEVELLPMARSEGIDVAPYSPLGGGLLTGKYARGASGRLTTDSRYKSRYAVQGMSETAQALTDMAAQMDTSPATLAVAWAAAHPGVTTPIISARNTEQLAPSLAALRFEMTPELYAEIEALSQRPAPATDRTEEA